MSPSAIPGIGSSLDAPNVNGTSMIHSYSSDVPSAVPTPTRSVTIAPRVCNGLSTGTRSAVSTPSASGEVAANSGVLG